MTTVGQIINAVADFAPLSLQESWDNSGVQVGATDIACTGVMLCVDVTPDVIAEAAARGCNLVIAHHPLLFRGLKQIVPGNNIVQQAVIDAIRGGILKEYELPRPCVEVLGKTHGERINTMIADVVRNSEGQNRVVMSDEVREASDRLREFLFENVYLDEWRKQEEQRCDHVVNGLFDHYVAHPEQLPGEYLEILYLEGAERAICDFIAGMTDRYAICLYQSIFIPKAFNRY